MAQAARDNAIYEIRIGDKVNALYASGRIRRGIVEQITIGFVENPGDHYLVNFDRGSVEWMMRHQITPQNDMGGSLLPFAPRDDPATEEAIAEIQAARDAAAAKKAAAATKATRAWSG